MSYAGPASRGKRAPDMQIIAPAPSRGSAPATGRAPRAQSYTSSDGRTAVFAAGAVLGLLVGAGLALLLAPQSGAEARHALIRQGRRLGRRSHDAWDDLRDELGHAARSRWRARRRAQEDEPDE